MSLGFGFEIFELGTIENSLGSREGVIEKVNY